MQIIYNENPLKSEIILDDKDKEILKLKILIKELEESLYSISFALEENKLDRAFDIACRVYEYDDKPSKIQARVDMLYDEFLAECCAEHCGDCTCVASTCSKCMLEQLLGIDTIKGLSKHEANHIHRGFSSFSSIDEVIENLDNYEIYDLEQWMIPYVPRWKEEAKRAANWLVNYKNKYLK